MPRRRLAGSTAKPREVPLGSAMAGVASANHQLKPATTDTEIIKIQRIRPLRLSMIFGVFINL